MGLRGVSRDSWQGPGRLHEYIATFFDAVRAGGDVS